MFNNKCFSIAFETLLSIHTRSWTCEEKNRNHSTAGNIKQPCSLQQAMADSKIKQYELKQSRKTKGLIYSIRMNTKL